MFACSGCVVVAAGVVLKSDVDGAAVDGVPPSVNPEDVSPGDAD